MTDTELDFSFYLIELRYWYYQLSGSDKLRYHWLKGAPHPDDQNCALDMWDELD